MRKKQEAHVRDDAVSIARVLEEDKAQNVLVLDMREICSWCDFLVLATTASSTHAGGLAKDVVDYAETHGMNTTFVHRTVSGDAGQGAYGWLTVDLCTVVVHLMTEEMRGFYELERLWAMAPKVEFNNAAEE
jgi:ribosome-associated protein